MRVLLLSDLHYTTDETPEALTARAKEAKPSLAAGDAFGLTQKEKLARAIADMNAECAEKPADLVLFLGDLSLDDPPYRCLPENYCEACMAALRTLPCPVYVLPGNHDSYPPAGWEASTGCARQYVIDTKEALFVMLDTFALLPAAGASGSGYSGVDCDFLESVLSKDPGKPVILCAHGLDPAKESGRFFEILRAHKEIKLMFRGHTHLHGVLSVEAVPLADIGGYAYNGMIIENKYTFSVFDPAWAWGYQVLEIENGTLTTYFREIPMTYHAANGVFVRSGGIADKMIIK